MVGTVVLWSGLDSLKPWKYLEALSQTAHSYLVKADAEEAASISPVSVWDTLGG